MIVEAVRYAPIERHSSYFQNLHPTMEGVRVGVEVGDVGSFKPDRDSTKLDIWLKIPPLIFRVAVLAQREQII